jgi:hypothetical protein
VLGTLAAHEAAGADVHAFHGPILERLVRLIERGQKAGDFDSGVSAEWLAAAFLGLMHTAADAVAEDRMSEAEAEAALARTVPAALGASTA